MDKENIIFFDYFLEDSDSFKVDSYFVVRIKKDDNKFGWFSFVVIFFINLFYW